MNSPIAIQNQAASVKPTIPSDKPDYQEQLHTKRVLAYVYANKLMTRRPCWRLVLDTCEPVFPVDPHAAIRQVTGKPVPPEGAVTTVFDRPRNLTLIGAVYIEVIDDKLRSALRKLDNNAAAAELAQDLRTLRQAEVGIERSGIVPAHVSEAMERMGE